MTLQKVSRWVLVWMFLLVTSVVPAQAKHQLPYDYGHTGSSGILNPIVKSTLVGAGVGAAVGAITSESDRTRGAVRGALIGGGAGAIYGYVRDRGYPSRSWW